MADSNIFIKQGEHNEFVLTVVLFMGGYYGYKAGNII
jgi:hypothetical protein